MPDSQGKAGKISLVVPITAAGGHGLRLTGQRIGFFFFVVVCEDIVRLTAGRVVARCLSLQSLPIVAITFLCVTFSFRETQVRFCRLFLSKLVNQRKDVLDCGIDGRDVWGSDSNRSRLIDFERRFLLLPLVRRSGMQFRLIAVVRRSGRRTRGLRDTDLQTFGCCSVKGANLMPNGRLTIPSTFTIRNPVIRTLNPIFCRTRATRRADFFPSASDVLPVIVIRPEDRMLAVADGFRSFMNTACPHSALEHGSGRGLRDLRPVLVCK